MAHPSKRKGDRYEALVRDYLANEGHLVERIPAGASNDRGDLWLPPDVTVQCKNVERIDLAGWWRETEHQRQTNGHPYGFVVHKRRGVVSAGSQWVTTDLATMSRLILAAHG